MIINQKRTHNSNLNAKLEQKAPTGLRNPYQKTQQTLLSLLRGYLLEKDNTGTF